MSSNPFALLAADEPEDVPVKQVHHAVKVQDAHSKGPRKENTAPSTAAVSSSSAATSASNKEKNDRDRGDRKKREFDRHQSGTGRQGRAAFEKRGGGGKYNWGDDKTAASEALAGGAAAAGGAEGATEGDDEQREHKDNAKVSNEPAVRDYESYLKQAAEQRAKAVLPAARRPGEGEDQSKWGNTVAVKKEEENFIVLAKKTSSSQKSSQKDAKQKQAVDSSLLNFRVSNPDADRPPRERGERGERGDRGDRPSRGGDRGEHRGERPARGGDRGERPDRKSGGAPGAASGSPAGPKGGNQNGPRQGGRRDAPPNFQDANAFPTLG